jgi:hypothetical protein
METNGRFTPPTVSGTICGGTAPCSKSRQMVPVKENEMKSGCKSVQSLQARKEKQNLEINARTMNSKPLRRYTRDFVMPNSNCTKLHNQCNTPKLLYLHYLFLLVSKTLRMEIDTLRSSPFMHRTLVAKRTHVVFDVRDKTPRSTDHDR